MPEAILVNPGRKKAKKKKAKAGRKKARSLPPRHRSGPKKGQFRKRKKAATAKRKSVKRNPTRAKKANPSRKKKATHATPPRHRSGPKKGQFRKRATSARKTSKRRPNPGRSGGVLIRPNPGRTRMKMFERVVTDEVGGVVGFGGAVLSRNIVKWCQDFAPDTLGGDTAGGLLELLVGAVSAAGAHMLPKNAQPFGDFAAAGMVTLGVARIVSDNAPESFADLRGLEAGNPMAGYGRGMRRRGVAAITPTTSAPALDGHRGLRAITPDAAAPEMGNLAKAFDAPWPA